MELSGKKVIDSIIITYDDGSVWSYGLGGGKSNGKTIMFAKNEYLVRNGNVDSRSRKSQFSCNFVLVNDNIFYIHIR
jgi:hypothetical protein